MKPSQNDVEVTLRVLEIDDPVEKANIRAYWRRERQSSYLHLSGRQIWVAAWKILFWVALTLSLPLALARKWGIL